MAPNSRLLIHEYMLQKASAGDDEFPRAPYPLLFNFGAGVVRSHYQDICMMYIMNGKERTFDAVVKLGACAGLKYTKLWDMGEAHVVEFGPD